MQTDRRAMGRWAPRSASDPRVVSSYRNSSWILAPIGREYICLPPNGATLPFSLFAAMVGEPMTDHCMITLANVGRCWMEEVYGERLEHMLKPFQGHHDFTVSCAGIPVRFLSGTKTWNMSFTLSGILYEYQHGFLEGLLAELATAFGEDSDLDLSEARIQAFEDEVSAARMRSQEALLIGHRIKSLTRKDPALLSKDPEIFAAMRRVRDIDLPEIRTHRQALGLDDAPFETFDVSHKSLETLLTDIKQRG